MNGGFPRAYFSHWGRLYAALTVSCLLHLGLVLMPELGTSTTVNRSAGLGGLKGGPSRALEVRLEQASAHPRARVDARRGSDVLPIPAPTYYSSDQLTRPPRPTSEPKLDVPRSIARSVSGRVILKLWIDELGNVASVEVESSNLPETVSGTAAAAFGKLQFLPGEIDGRRVRTLMRIEVAYVNGKRPPP
jgi:TonB family protein